MLKSFIVAAALVAGATAGPVSTGPTVVISSTEAALETRCCEVPLKFTFSETVTAFTSDMIDVSLLGGEFGNDNSLFAGGVVADPVHPTQYFMRMDLEAVFVRGNGVTNIKVCLKLESGKTASASDGAVNSASRVTCFDVRSADVLRAVVSSSYDGVTYLPSIPFSVIFLSKNSTDTLGDNALRVVRKREAGTAGITVVSRSNSTALPDGMREVSDLSQYSTSWDFKIAARADEVVTVRVDAEAALDNWFEPNEASNDHTMTMAPAAPPQDCIWTWTPTWRANSFWSECDTKTGPQFGFEPQGLQTREFTILTPAAGGGSECPTFELLKQWYTDCTINNGDDCKANWQVERACEIPGWKSCYNHGFTSIPASNCVLNEYGFLTEEETALIYVDPWVVFNRNAQQLNLDDSILSGYKFEAETQNGNSPYFCDCGANCFHYNDCCEDRTAYCGREEKKTCEDRCPSDGSASRAISNIKGSCGCDERCVEFGTCCDEATTVEVCPGLTGYETCAFKGCLFDPTPREGGGFAGCSCDAQCVPGGEVGSGHCCSDYRTEPTEGDNGENSLWWIQEPGDAGNPRGGTLGGDTSTTTCGAYYDSV